MRYICTIIGVLKGGFHVQCIGTVKQVCMSEVRFV